MAQSFGDRLALAVQRYGRLCVGIDPHPGFLHSWGLADTAAGAREFSMRLLDAAAGRVAIVKPQVAFYERFGSAGFVVLEELLSEARKNNLLVISDAKRGDIGSTMAGYAAAWLSSGAALESDALTVSPYLGVAALDAAFSAAVEHNKGLFVLAATSNPEAVSLQTARMDDNQNIAEHVALVVDARNRALALNDESWGSFGLVIGATVDLAKRGIPERLDVRMPILAPGFGFQGAKLHDIDRLFGWYGSSVLANESRGIAEGGPNELVERILARKAAITEGGQ